MKKIFSFAILSAVALAGAMTFTACSSNDEVKPAVNPTFDGEAVKTTFTISVGDVKGTRMSANSVQKNEEFQGMTDIYLFPAKAAITGSTVASESYIHMPDFTSFDAEYAGINGKYYKDVSFSVGVSNFLFYAATATSNKDNGELKPSYLPIAKANLGKDGASWTADWAATPLVTTSEIGSITFDLVPYQRGMTLTNINGTTGTTGEGASTIKVLNDVDAALATAIADATTASTADATTTPASIITDLTDLQNTIRNDFGSAGSHNYKEYAGSSASIKILMEKLYNALKNMEASLTSTTAAPVDYAKPMLDIIADASGAAFSAAGDVTNGYTLTWSSDPNFPGSLNLPDGAVAIKFNGTDKFAFVEIDAAATPNPVGLIASSVGKYVHPARLYYTVNTPAMIKDADYLSLGGHSTMQWGDGTNDATNSGTITYEYTEGAIKSTTRSVIMKDQVQYAVGRLDVQALVKDGINIYDSGSGISGDMYENPQPVTVPAAGYTLTGVLIGGQKQVDWKFEPTPVSGAPEWTIYDNSMTATTAAVQGSSYSAANSTLALETATGTAVRIALEFVNNGNDFYGVNHNVIPAGSKFYLIANLVPGTNETANPNTLTQVFKQDYITTAKLTIGANSLASAYNVIPDLRSPKLEFGLSVNLEWRAGITFEQEF